MNDKILKVIKRIAPKTHRAEFAKASIFVWQGVAQETSSNNTANYFFV